MQINRARQLSDVPRPGRRVRITYDDGKFLDDANTKLAKAGGGGLVVIKSGTHSSEQYCAELVTGPGYPDDDCAPMGDAEPKVLDYEFGVDPRTTINLVLFRELCRSRYLRD